MLHWQVPPVCETRVRLVNADACPIGRILEDYGGLCLTAHVGEAEGMPNWGGLPQSKAAKPLAAALWWGKTAKALAAALLGARLPKRWRRLGRSFRMISAHPQNCGF